jgi:hypothetical protein
MRSYPVTALAITTKNQYASDSELVNEAYSEYSQDSYGTDLDVDYIERTQSMTPTAARRHIYSAIDDLSSGAIIIPVFREEDITMTVEKIKVTFTGQELTKLYQDNYSEDLIINKVEAIVGVGKVESVQNFKLPAKRKPVATATEGKAVTKYEIAGDYGNIVAQGFDSQADARAAALKLMEKETKHAALYVRAHIEREGDELNLVTISRPVPESIEIEVKANIATAKPNAKLGKFFVAYTVYHL